MAQAEATLVQEGTRSRRDTAIGIIALLAAAGILIPALGTGGQQSTFVLTSHRGGVSGTLELSPSYVKVANIHSKGYAAE